MTDDERKARIIIEFVDGRLGESEMLRQLRELDARPLHERPPRKMPTLWALARYWADRFGLDDDDLAAPFCFGCMREVPGRGRTPAERWQDAAGRLDRAHLVDRWRGGLDGPQNVIPLCTLCHRLMPTFGPEDGEAALTWVTEGGCTSFILEAWAAAAD